MRALVETAYLWYKLPLETKIILSVQFKGELKTVKYFSTRGDVEPDFEEVKLTLTIIIQSSFNLSQVVLAGLAPDGGLYIEIPQFPYNWESERSDLSY